MEEQVSNIGLDIVKHSIMTGNFVVQALEEIPPKWQAVSSNVELDTDLLRRRPLFSC